MTNEEWIMHFENAPEPVRQYLLDEKAVQNEDAAQRKTGFENDAWPRVMGAVWDAVFSNISERDFRDRIKKLSVNRRAEDVEKAVLFHVVLPLADLVTWDVDGRLQELGVPLADVQSSFRICLRPVSYGAAVRRIVMQAKISLLSEELVRRARDLFVSFHKGIRTLEQLKEMLQRAQSESGVGLTREQADAFAAAMGDFLATTQVMSEQQYAEWWNAYQQKEQEKAVAPAVGGQLEGDELSLNASKSLRDANSELEKATDDAVGLAAVKELDDYLTRRLRNIISTRFRDVRNPAQAKEMLQRPRGVGGLGLEAVEGERVGAVIEQIYAERHGRFIEEEKKKIEMVKQEQQVKNEERKKQESEEHRKWFEEKTQQMDAAAVFQKSAAVVAAGEALREPRAMDAIVPHTRLMGLAEELGSMTWETFRRMSKDPQQAVERTLGVLETLKRESFERWTEGVQAWRASPIQRSYLQLVAESFAAGKPVAEMVEERKATDPAMPSGSEIAALIALNARITFY